MTEQERINAEVQTKLALQDAKFNMFMQEMREIRLSIDSMGKQVRNLSLTAMGAIGAMVVTVIISLLKN